MTDITRTIGKTSSSDHWVTIGPVEPHHYPALCAWQRRYARDEHRHRFDDLWRAASWEAAALEAARDGADGRWRRCMLHARDALLASQRYA